MNNADDKASWALPAFKDAICMFFRWKNWGEKLLRLATEFELLLLFFFFYSFDIMMNQIAQAPPAQSSCASSVNTNTPMFNEPLFCLLHGYLR